MAAAQGALELAWAGDKKLAAQSPVAATAAALAVATSTSWAALGGADGDIALFTGMPAAADGDAEAAKAKPQARHACLPLNPQALSGSPEPLCCGRLCTVLRSHRRAGSAQGSAAQQYKRVRIRPAQVVRVLRGHTGPVRSLAVLEDNWRSRVRAACYF